MESRPIMMVYALPPDPELRAIGVVAVRHGQMEDSLRMVVKSLEGLDPRAARMEFSKKFGAGLREAVLKRAKRRLGDRPAYSRLMELVDRAWAASRERDRLVHAIWVAVIDGPSAVLDRSGEPFEQPSAKDLYELAREMVAVTNAIHEARLYGFLREALEPPEKD